MEMSRLQAVNENTLAIKNPSEDFQHGRNSSSKRKRPVDVYKCLPYLEASLLATVLEDTITEMRILVECNNEMRITKTMSDMASLLQLKYGVAQHQSNDELEGIDQEKLECNKYKLNKLDSDRKSILAAFMSTYKDLTQYQNFDALRTNVTNYVSIDRYRLKLCEEEAKHRMIRRELNKQMRQQRNHITSSIYDTNATIDALRSKVEDATFNSEIRSRYVEQWQISRTEQHLQTILDKEAAPSSIIEYYKQRAESEQRVHSEVEVLINIFINETLDKVDKWMTKYDTDMEGIDLKIQFKKNEFQNMYDKRINLEDTIEQHNNLMKEWILFKENREKFRQYREKMTNSAITVQAWWRGILVRRQLGPYKVAKKKTAKKGKATYM